MNEIAKDIGSTLAKAWFAYGQMEGSAVPRSEFMEYGKLVSKMVIEDEGEQDRKDFLKGWEQGWEDSTLLDELLSQDDPILAECTRLADRRMLVVERQTFRRARLGIGSLNGWDGGYDDVWDFDSPEAALEALQTWQSDTPEPDGWIRHYGTGRYRINGDKSLEWVKDDDSIGLEQNIVKAIKFSKRQDFFMDSIQENSLHIGSEFPAHSKCFTVASKGVVRWLVYHCCDRSVVLSVEEMETISIGSVIERLKGGKSG